MRDILKCCNRLSRRGLCYCVVSPRSHVYHVYRYSSVLSDWFRVRTCARVCECLDYLRAIK